MFILADDAFCRFLQHKHFFASIVVAPRAMIPTDSSSMFRLDASHVAAHLRLRRLFVIFRASSACGSGNIIV